MDDDLTEIFKDFFKWLIDNYEDMEVDAKNKADHIFDGMSDLIGSKIDKMPESVQKRRYNREYKKGSGGHWNAENLFRILESEPNAISDITLESEKIAINTIQCVIDFLLDISERLHSGYVNVNCLSMFYGCVDELFTSLHLARHHFYVQAYAHLRTVLENIDLVELFSSEPEWATLWEEGSFKERWKELNPAATREKIGKGRFDSIYSFLSENGTHATFRTVQARTAIKKTDTPRTTLKIWFAGTPMIHHMARYYLLSLNITNRLLIKIVKFGEDYLNDEETTEILDQQLTAHIKFFENKYIPWAEENDLDTKKMNGFIEELKIIINE